MPVLDQSAPIMMNFRRARDLGAPTEWFEVVCLELGRIPAAEEEIPLASILRAAPSRLDYACWVLLRSQAPGRAIFRAWLACLLQDLRDRLPADHGSLALLFNELDATAEDLRDGVQDRPTTLALPSPFDYGCAVHGGFDPESAAHGVGYHVVEALGNLLLAHRALDTHALRQGCFHHKQARSWIAKRAYVLDHAGKHPATLQIETRKAGTEAELAGAIFQSTSLAGLIAPPVVPVPPSAAAPPMNSRRKRR